MEYEAIAEIIKEMETAFAGCRNAEQSIIAMLAHQLYEYKKLYIWMRAKVDELEKKQEEKK